MICNFVRVFFMVLDLRFVEAVVRHLPLFISCGYVVQTCSGSCMRFYPSPYYSTCSLSTAFGWARCGR